MKITELEQTCIACPTSWTFRTDNNREVYVRYRWGHLRVNVSPPSGETGSMIFSNDTDVTILSEQLGDAFDGSLDWETVEPKLLPLDVEAEVEKAEREDAVHKMRFETDAAYRRETWLEGLLEMNETIDEMNKASDQMQKDGYTFANDTAERAKPFTQEKIEEFLDEYEEKYQKGE